MDAREAIIRIEQHNRVHAAKEFPFAVKITEALEMAVEALKKQDIEEVKKTGIIGKWEGTPIIEIPALISWLNDQKYTNVDETSDIMTEEFEKEHQWELSRNSFINNMIRKLKELK